MNKETAKNYALEALIWLTKDDQQIESLLLSSGVRPNEIRVRYNDSEFLGFILDFVMASDELVFRFSKDLNILPKEIQEATSILLGGDLPHWT